MFSWWVCTKPVRSQVSSYFSQFALSLVNSYSFVGQSVLKIFLRSIRTHLVNPYTFWSIRSLFSQFALILNSTNLEGNIKRKQKRKHPNITEKKCYMRHSNQFIFLDFNRWKKDRKKDTLQQYNINIKKHVNKEVVIVSKLSIKVGFLRSHVEIDLFGRKSFFFFSVFITGTICLQVKTCFTWDMLRITIMQLSWWETLIINWIYFCVIALQWKTNFTNWKIAYYKQVL